jgi:hypothetical protein
MADYLVTGKKGNGKSLVVVGRIRDALRQGRVVATNLDLDLVAMLGPYHRTARVIRLPDKPERADLDAIGSGNAEVDERRNGLLVLDELATWMNARSYSDKGRQAVLEWFVHSRKLGWDTYVIAQGPAQIDKQMRETQCEYHVICRRMDKIKLAGVKLPRVHVAFVRYGMDRDSIVSERWVYRGTDLFACYDTRQRFREDCGHGPYSLLPPWHLDGRYRHAPDWRYRLFGRLPPIRARVTVTKKLPLVETLAKLPPDERVRHWRRLDRLGAFA